MQALLTNFLMQPDATNGTTAQPGAPAAPTSPAPGGLGGGEFQLLLLPLMFGLFYFLMIRPQQKRQRETDEMLKALKRGDVVRTSGGIRGEVAEISDADVMLIVADKVKINVLRSHIASKVLPESSAGAGKDKT